MKLLIIFSNGFDEFINNIIVTFTGNLYVLYTIMHHDCHDLWIFIDISIIGRLGRYTSKKMSTSTRFRSLFFVLDKYK